MKPTATSDLPEERTEFPRDWSTIRVDLAGPLNVKIVSTTGKKKKEPIIT